MSLLMIDNSFKGERKKKKKCVHCQSERDASIMSAVFLSHVVKLFLQIIRTYPLADFFLFFKRLPFFFFHQELQVSISELVAMTGPN